MNIIDYCPIVLSISVHLHIIFCAVCLWCHWLNAFVNQRLCLDWFDHFRVCQLFCINTLWRFYSAYISFVIEYILNISSASWERLTLFFWSTTCLPQVWQKLTATYRRVDGLVTCRLTACTPRMSSSPNARKRVWENFTFYWLTSCNGSWHHHL